MYWFLINCGMWYFDNRIVEIQYSVETVQCKQYRKTKQT